ncbi:thioredoxin domain-containing protein [Maribacter sedimenticola]|nr:thioredoxin domain-containing protein [Maribacter sedimenticola]
MQAPYTNDLIHESSPYLLQHAHNPVNWVAWSQKALLKAKNENKLILISIGYAACHWCHVMEHECFEDEDVAMTMNKNFINIKVDREERPDIDHIYMDALQMMTGSGGWPLNILALPDGRPFWGATFVKKDQWIQVLNQLQQLYENEPNKIIGYATNMHQGLKEINSISAESSVQNISATTLAEVVTTWSAYFDTYLGGYKRAPKFMMPVNINFLLHYGQTQQDQMVKEYVATTLTRMAWGGIFDHVGGGFSRYAVDTKWHVPHFEKMLYDNGLLISLYSKAFAADSNALYKNVALQCINFLKEELLDENHGFYSSLDADSLTPKGTLEEGAYYVWTEAELKQLLQEDFTLFSDYFNINSYGYWEDDNYVLIRDDEAASIAEKHNLNTNVVVENISKNLTQLKIQRQLRAKPRLDDKILTSWNGLALKGLTDAYNYLGNSDILDLAVNNGNFIVNQMLKANGILYRNHKNGKSTISGFLEDYAAVIEGFLGLYEATFNLFWMNKSVELTKIVIENFTDPKTGLFYFTAINGESLIRNTIEVADNVIPSSNSIMALNLLKLSKYYPEESYQDRLEQMMGTMHATILENPQNHANWLHVSSLMNEKFYEVVVIGENYERICKKMQKSYLPYTIFAASDVKTSEFPLFKNRYVEDKTMIYVCHNGTCHLPVERVEDALNLLT